MKAKTYTTTTIDISFSEQEKYEYQCAYKQLKELCGRDKLKGIINDKQWSVLMSINECLGVSAGGPTPPRQHWTVEKQQ